MARKLRKWNYMIVSSIGLLSILLAPSSADGNNPEDYDYPEVLDNVTDNYCPDFSSGDVSNRILILPKHQTFKNFGGTTGKALFYFFMMLYVFLGISIASNIFMLSIEIICSKTKKVYTIREEDGIQIREETNVRLWSDTVANLTLISLGTSAPEILLSVIETLGNDFCPGALGPGTIVGSASYNLMIITAVCIISVPSETIKRVRNYKVFLTTSAFAMGAYIWLVFIIQVWSNNVVEIWEAFITLLMFPALVGVSYWAELNFCTRGKKSVRRQSITSTLHEPSIAPISEGEAGEPLFHFYNEWDNLVGEDGNLNQDKMKQLYNELHKIADLSDLEIATVLATKLIQFKGQTALWYRIRAIKALVAGQRVFPVLNEKLKEVMDVLNDLKRTETGKRGELRPLFYTPDVLKKKAVVEFTATCVAIPGFVGQFTVLVKRFGKEDFTVFCKVDSYNGSAQKNVAYMPISKEFVFEPYVVEQKILVTVIGDKHKNKDSNFFMKLTLPKENNEPRVSLGAMSIMEVVIMDIEQPGEVQFVKKGQIVKDDVATADLEVERVSGADGLLTVKWRATPSPTCTRFPEMIEGSLQFEHGEIKKMLEIPINRRGGPSSGQDEQFDVELIEVVGGGGKVGNNPKCTVAITADEAFKLRVERIIEMTETLALQSSIPDQTYVDQMKSAFIVNGDREEARKASRNDVILHWVSVPWKAIFCFLPPPHRLGGWPCFVLTLCMIGLLTAITGDMANIFGDCLGLDPVTTGVTFVAIGTSLPDTFASRIAALQSPTADAAIGNIMGSNSVNVFLGLGLPWTFSTIYYQIKYDSPVRVNAKSLAFIVTIYTMVGSIAQTVLWLRRHSMTYGCAELGGPTGTKWLTGISLIIGWLFYVTMAITVSQGVEGISRFADNLARFLQI